MRTTSVAERVAALPPGPELSTALAHLELARVPGDDIVDVLRAQARQLAHDQARLLATMVEVSRTIPGADVGGRLRADEAFLRAAGEVAAAFDPDRPRGGSGDEFRRDAGVGVAGGVRRVVGGSVGSGEGVGVRRSPRPRHLRTHR